MKFDLGQVFVTIEIAEAQESKSFSSFVGRCLTRHVSCDWGDLTEEDIETNEAAMKNGGRLFSSYKFDQPYDVSDGYTGKRDRIWIITEADRSSTTVLFPDEY